MDMAFDTAALAGVSLTGVEVAMRGRAPAGAGAGAGLAAVAWSVEGNGTVEVTAGPVSVSARVRLKAQLGGAPAAPARLLDQAAAAAAAAAPAAAAAAAPAAAAASSSKEEEEEEEGGFVIAVDAFATAVLGGEDDPSLWVNLTASFAYPCVSAISASGTMDVNLGAGSRLQGRAVQADPGFSYLTPRLVSTLEINM